MEEGIWIFCSPQGNFPSGVFLTKELAETWVARHCLNGILTQYPVDIGTYEWAIEKGYFVPKTEVESSSDFIGKFSCASQRHDHYENGVCQT